MTKFNHKTPSLQTDELQYLKSASSHIKGRRKKKKKKKGRVAPLKGKSEMRSVQSHLKQPTVLQICPQKYVALSEKPINDVRIK